MGNGGQTKRQQITNDYIGGLTVPQLAEKYGRTRGGIQTSLWQWGVRLPPEERARRRTRNFEGTLRRARPPAWPDCPEHLKEDYKLLRKYMTAREARTTLEGRG